MKIHAVSLPAQYMALFRAIETARPGHKRLFSDPLAAAFLSRELQWISRAASLPLLGTPITKMINRQRSGALSSGIARTRYIDELVEKGIAGGARQLIILGAGFDTRAQRMEALRTVPVFEFDLPETARFKRSRLESLPEALTDHVRYCEADFNRQDLAQLFRETRVDVSLPTLVLWEGVTNFLSPASVNAIFRVLGSFVRGSSVIFTYIDKRVLDSPSLYDATDRLLLRRSSKDEPWAFGFHPDELPHYLDLFEFTLQADTGASEYRHMYMPERAGWNRGYGFYRVAVAGRK